MSGIIYSEKSWIESHPDDDEAEEGVFVDMFADPDPLSTFTYDFPSLPTITLTCIHPSNGQTLDSTGLTIWRAAPQLSSFLASNPALIAGKRVLELGGGLGLCSVTAAKLSPSAVVCTDGDTEVLAAMRSNVASNFSSGDATVDCRQCIWGENLSPLASAIGDRFDVIIGADIIYVPEILEPLFRTVKRFLKEEGGKFILSYARRNVKIDYVHDMAKAFGFEWSSPEGSEGCFVFTRTSRTSPLSPSSFAPLLPPPVSPSPHPFDDGHTPLMCKLRSLPTLLAPSHPSRPSPDSNFISVQDDVAPSLLLDLIYLEATLHTPQSNAFGTYVEYEECLEMAREVEEEGGTMEDRAEEWTKFWMAELEGKEGKEHGAGGREEYQSFLARELLHSFFFTAGHSPAPSTGASAVTPPSLVSGSSMSPSSVLPSSLPRSSIHGFALWSLASVRSLPHGVSYHVDYAELVRYKTGVIHLPVYAGSVHCTRPSDTGGWEGGGYYANLKGLGHYEATGYKCAKVPGNRGSKGVLLDPTPEDGNGWVEVPYRYGRGIFHTGELPHQSGEVKYSGEGETGNADRWGRTRVMVGINAFGHDVGPEVSTAPEHSPAFNREVKLCQIMAVAESKDKAKEGGSSGGGGMGMEAIMGDKALRKMLVLAKREKIKKEMAEERLRMEECAEETCRKEGGEVGVLVRTLAAAVHRRTTCPSFDAAHVQINLMVKEGKLEVVEGGVVTKGFVDADECRVRIHFP